LDSDGDGLTDVLEDKLRTNPASADTDQDGVPDDVDGLPQVSVRAAPHPGAEIVRAVEQEILDHSPTPLATSIAPRPFRLESVPCVPLGPDSEPHPVTFMQADRALFTGLMVPESIVVSSKGELSALNARYGLHLLESTARCPVPIISRSRSPQP
jgi:hypothetical protein